MALVNRKVVYEILLMIGMTLFAANNALALLGKGSTKKSCREILEADGSVGSGEYTIDPDGTGPTAGSFKVYCDMDTSHGGGGWTLIAAQFEDSPITDWNTGINEATFTAPTAEMLDSCGASATGLCDSTKPSATGFALSSLQMPSNRREVAFGKSTNSTYIGYASYVYSASGNINPPVLLTNNKNKSQYYLHRRSDGSYNCHNPNLGFNASGAGSMQSNTLAFHINNSSCDQGESWDAWAFSPFQVSVADRGYYMGLADGLVLGTNNPFAWTVWVR